MMAFKLRTMAWLASSERQRTAAHVELSNVDKTVRLILLTQLICAIGLLHKHGWVFGDLNLRDAVFALSPPKLLLLDCGCSGAISDPSRRKFSTPFWDPPEYPKNSTADKMPQQELPDAVTDVYKLGLAILRCLTPGKGAATSRTVSRLNGELDGEGTILLSRALSADRASRPTATELFSYFGSMVSRRVGVPELIRTRLAASALVRENFDVFLCHNAADKPAVRWTAERLRERGILPWLDESELPPGRPWQEELERQIGNIGAAAVVTR